MENILFRVANHADIDTRRAMGFKPRKMVLPNLHIKFNFLTKRPYGALPDDKYFFMVIDFENRIKFYKLFSFLEDTYGITYMWMHSKEYTTPRYEFSIP